MRVFITSVGLTLMVIAAISLLQIDDAGFPDGYISPYDRLTLGTGAALAALALFVGIFLLARGVFKKAGKLDVGVALVASALLLAPLFIIDNCPRLDSCAQAFQEITGTLIDDGQGG